MATKPTAPVRSYSFTSNSTNNPSSQQPGNELDTTYDSIINWSTPFGDWVSTVLTDTGAFKPGVVDQQAVDPAVFAQWEQDMEAAAQPYVDSAAASAGAAALSETNAANSEAGVAADASAASTSASNASTSETNAENSANYAGSQANNAETSYIYANLRAGDANSDAQAAQLSEQAAFLWAEHMAGPVKADGNGNPQPEVGDGYYSARWWANYAERRVSEGAGAVHQEFYTTNIINQTVPFTVNNTDFTGQNDQPDSFIPMDSGTSYIFVVEDRLYMYIGPRTNTSIGVGGSYATVDTDFQQVGVYNHEDLAGRDEPDSHPTSAITGLEDFMAGHDHSEAQITDLDRTRWKGAFVNGNTYEFNDMAVEGGYLGVVTGSATTDHLEPQTDGPEAVSLDRGLAMTGKTNVSLVTSVTRMLFTKDGYLNAVWIRVPLYTPTTRISLTIVDLISGRTAKASNILASSGGWVLIAAKSFIVRVGSHIEFILDYIDTDGAPPVTGGWNSLIGSPPPASAQFTVTSATDPTGMTMSYTDLDGGDRITELQGINADAVVTIIETADQERSLRVKVLAKDLSDPNYVAWVVDTIDTGNKAIRSNQTCSIEITQVGALPSHYYEEIGHYTANPPSFADVVTILYFDGVSQGVNSA
ncbi:MAG: hypothetical protein DRR06_18620, partial [Gammaproteobacteria bacterium]